MESQWVQLLLRASASSSPPSLVVRAMRRSRAGRVMIGTRDNERAADAMAVPTTRVKLQTFVLLGRARRARRCAVRHRARAGRRRPGHVPAGRSIEVFSFAVIGGLGSVAGAHLAASSLFCAARLRARARCSAATSSPSCATASRAPGLLFILYFLPGGLWQAVQRLRDRLAAAGRGAARHVVPSLVADERTTARSSRPDHAEDETEVIAGALS